MRFFFLFFFCFLIFGGGLVFTGHKNKNRITLFATTTGQNIRRNAVVAAHQCGVVGQQLVLCKNESWLVLGKNESWCIAVQASGGIAAKAAKLYEVLYGPFG